MRRLLVEYPQRSMDTRQAKVAPTFLERQKYALPDGGV